MTAEQQFSALMNVLIPYANQQLASGSVMLPVGVVLNDAEQAEVITVTNDMADDLQGLVNVLQAELVACVREEPINATCIAYPDYDNLWLVCLLENKENYSTLYRVPLDTINEQLMCVPQNTEVENSYVYIFPLCEDNPFKN